MADVTFYLGGVAPHDAAGLVAHLQDHNLIPKAASEIQRPGSLMPIGFCCVFLLFPRRLRAPRRQRRKSWAAQQ
jgi:hypothetical protein